MGKIKYEIVGDDPFLKYELPSCKLPVGLGGWGSRQQTLTVDLFESDLPLTSELGASSRSTLYQKHKLFFNVMLILS